MRFHPRESRTKLNAACFFQLCRFAALVSSTSNFSQGLLGLGRTADGRNGAYNRGISPAGAAARPQPPPTSSWG